MGLCIAEEWSIAVSGVWRLVHLLAFYRSEPKRTPTHTDGPPCARLQKTKSKLLSA